MRKLRLIVLIFLLLFCIEVCTAQEIRLDVKEHVLRNGMKVLILERHTSPTFVGFIQCRVGSANERTGLTGVSHLLEHMLFKGTKIFGTWNYAAEVPLMKKMDALDEQIRAERAKLQTAYGRGDPGKIRAFQKEIRALQKEQERYIIKNEIWGIYQQNGADVLNASTSYDGTQYYVSLPSNRLELWMLIESDRMANPVLREFYSERDVVQEERRMSIDNRPWGRLFENLMATAYYASPYHWFVIGWPGDLENMRREDVERYFKTYYSPNNSVAVIVGDVKEEEVMRLMRKHFEPIPPQKIPLPLTTAEPTQVGERRVEVEFDAGPQLMIGFHGPPYGHRDQFALEICGEILSSGRTSRFYKKIVEEKKMAQYVHGYNLDQRLGNIFIIEANVKQPHTSAELEQAIYEELEKLKTEPISDWELQKVRTQIEANFVRGLGYNLGLAFRLAHAENLTGSWRNFDQRSRLQAVTPKDIMEAARKYFVKKNRTVVILVPVTKEEKKEVAK